MKKESLKDKAIGLFKKIYVKLVKINDTPQKVALGLGLGAFAGILPGTGPVAALFLAFIFRANRASAFLAGLLTNTWLSFITFVLAVKIGSVILGVNWQEIYRQTLNLAKNFKWASLFKVSIFEVLLPLVIGYLVISFCLGLVVYLVSLLILKRRQGSLHVK